MFYDIDDCDIVSYADDNTPYASSSNLDAFIKKLEESTNNLFQWFRIIDPYHYYLFAGKSLRN